MRRLVATWLALLGLTALEILAATSDLRPAGELAILCIAFGMASLACVMFMRLPQAPALARIFAAAGVLWLTVLLGLGAVDPLTRTDAAVRVTRLP